MRVSRWIDGTVTVSVAAAPEKLHRFLSLIARAGLPVWDIRRREGRLWFSLSAREAARLRPLARRSRVRPHFCRKEGLPFCRKWALRRQGLLWGALAGWALVAWLSGCIWQIRVTGCQGLSENQVLAAAREEGVFPGCRLSQVDLDSAARAMQTRLPKAGWITVNTQGCLAEICLSERTEPQPAQEETPCNLVAECSGVIESISVLEGVAVVPAGSVVEKGQLLVSGVQQNRDGSFHLVHARAIIQARTRYTLAAQAPAQTQELRYTGEKTERARLLFFSFPIPLTLRAVPQGWYVRRSGGQAVPLLQGDTPLFLQWEQYRPVERVQKEQSRQEMEAQAENRLLLQALRELDGCTVLGSQSADTWTQTGLIREKVYECRQKIGVEQEILLH